MRINFKSWFILVFFIGLIGVAGNATPSSLSSAPIGVVVQERHTQEGGETISSGATIYDGDRLETQVDGILRVTLGGSQILLCPGTLGEVHALTSGFSATLTYGTVVISSPERQTFQLFADGATIRPAPNRATIAQVTWVDTNELLLTVNRGAIEVSIGDKAETIGAGQSYRMEIQPDKSGPQDIPPPGTEHGDSGDHRPHGPYHTARNRAVFIAIFGVSAAAGIGIWRALVSPSAP